MINVRETNIIYQLGIVLFNYTAIRFLGFDTNVDYNACINKIFGNFKNHI